MLSFLLIVGGFLMLISVGYALFMCAMFFVNKVFNHDKISFIEYIKKWDW